MAQTPANIKIGLVILSLMAGCGEDRGVAWQPEPLVTTPSSPLPTSGEPVEPVDPPADDPPQSTDPEPSVDPEPEPASRCDDGQRYPSPDWPEEAPEDHGMNRAALEHAADYACLLYTSDAADE